jgi:hypothetical protein
LRQISIRLVYANLLQLVIVNYILCVAAKVHVCHIGRETQRYLFFAVFVLDTVYQKPLVYDLLASRREV